jgi:geranylgeranyl reductase family protein
MERFDVLIIGGGPAGSTCARALQDGGMNVAVLDQATFPRDKVCAGWITPNVLQALEIDPTEYGRNHLLQPIRGFRIGLIGMPRGINDIRYHETVSYGIQRRDFDNDLLRRSGAHLFTGINVNSLRHEGWGWTVNNAFSAPMLVGAGGHGCPVARALGARPSGESTVVAKEIEFLLPESARETCEVHGQQPELYFCHDLAGYGWCFRKGDYLNIGLGRNDRWDLSKHVDEFLTFLQNERRVPEPPMHLKGHAYLLYDHSRRKRIANNALLVGDAAGLAYPQSGEGILPAVKSGLFAAEAILAAKGKYSAEQLAPYLARLQDQFGRGTAANLSLANLLPTWLGGPILRGLFRSAGWVRHVLLDQGFLHTQRFVSP